MTLSRRTVLMGLGALFAGGGALVGTGAFTTVQAERTVSVETAGDANAFLEIEPFGTGGNNSANAADYVDPSGDTVEINITDTDEGGKGVNDNAVTSIDRLLKVTNNGTQDVAVGFDNQYAIDEGDYTEAETPGGWGYAVTTDDNDNANAAVVVWASPMPGSMGKSLAEVRPRLNKTGFGGTTTLIDGNTDWEVKKKNDRTIGPGESVHIGAIVDTRERTVDNDDTPLSDLHPAELDETVSLLADLNNAN